MDETKVKQEEATLDWWTRKPKPIIRSPQMMEFLKFASTPHEERMSYTGDGGAWHKDADISLKNKDHADWVQCQVAKDRVTPPIELIRGKKFTLRQHLKHAFAEIRDRTKADGGLIPELDEGPDNPPEKG